MCIIFMHFIFCLMCLGFKNRFSKLGPNEYVLQVGPVYVSLPSYQTLLGELHIKKGKGSEFIKKDFVMSLRLPW